MKLAINPQVLHTTQFLVPLLVLCFYMWKAKFYQVGEKKLPCPDQCGLAGWVSYSKNKGHQLIPGQGICLGCRFDPWKGLEDQPIDVLSHIDVSFLLFLPPFPFI